MAEIVITEQNFEQEVMQSPIPVVVDFWAEWCGPCKIVGPIITELAHQYEGKIKVGKLDVDANNALTTRFNVLSIPTMKFFKGGQEVGEIIGAAPKAMIEAEMKKHI